MPGCCVALGIQAELWSPGSAFLCGLHLWVSAIGHRPKLPLSGCRAEEKGLWKVCRSHYLRLDHISVSESGTLGRASSWPGFSYLGVDSMPFVGWDARVGFPERKLVMQKNRSLFQPHPLLQKCHCNQFLLLKFYE